MENINIEEQEIENKEEKGLVVNEPKLMPKEITMWNNTEMFNNTYKMATIVAKSDIVPQAYKDKTGNCILAIDVANRMGLSPMVVMQNSQVVRGNFSWKGTACKAMIDGCGKYKSTRYVEVGEPNTDNYGVYLEAIDKNDNVVKGVTVTIGMAKKEGWWGNNPKWSTLTELMLRYRASAFFMRTECSSIAMGFLTAEENEDIYGVDQTQTKNKSSLNMLLDEEIENKENK